MMTSTPLPGMNQHIEAQRTSAAEVLASHQRAEVEITLRSVRSIEAAAGLMERESPLFAGSDASPQTSLFA